MLALSQRRISDLDCRWSLTWDLVVTPSRSHVDSNPQSCYQHFIDMTIFSQIISPYSELMDYSPYEQWVICHLPVKQTFMVKLNQEELQISRSADHTWFSLDLSQDIHQVPHKEINTPPPLARSVRGRRGRKGDHVLFVS